LSRCFRKPLNSNLLAINHYALVIFLKILVLIELGEIKG
jgi:hypothetical protein